MPTKKPDIKKRVNDFRVNWNQWHGPVHDSIAAFESDEMAKVCNELGIVELEGGMELPVLAGQLVNSLEHVARVLIALHELGWDKSDSGEPNYKIYENVSAYRTADGNLYAMMTMKYAAARRGEDGPLSEPFIEVRLMEPDSLKPWFDINFVLVGQFW